ncbi:hypothetical protein PS15m_006490 [Mucor circinelloides]
MTLLKNYYDVDWYTKHEMLLPKMPCSVTVKRMQWNYIYKLTYVNLEFPYVPQPDLILLKLVDFRLFHALVDTNVLTQLSDIAPSSLKALILSTCRLRNEETLYENFWSVIMSALSLDLLVHTRLNPVTKYDLNR